MEKLIKLLNEYEDYKEKETEIRNYTRRNVKCDGVERIECLREVDGELFGEEESTAIIICKGYMFIKWLVDNYKVTVYECTISDTYSKYETLLMILAISDNPIEDLIDLLK